MKFIIKTASVLSLLLISAASNAQTGGKIELSAGWGDQMFETLVCHEKAEPFGLLPESRVINVKEKYRFTQHWFVEGRYRFKKWLAAGAMIDYSGVSWDDNSYNGRHVLLQRNGRRSFHNISLMPTVSFTYYNHPYVQLHSGLGAGLNINTGTERDYMGRFTVVAPAAYLNFFGARGCYDRYFAGIDLGMLISIKNKNEIYLLGSRLVSVSVGITF